MLHADAFCFSIFLCNLFQQQPEEKKEEETKAPDLSEEEKLQILSSQKFQEFFDYSSRVIERKLAEDVSF